jgi:transposase
MPAQRKYPDELRERAVKMVLEIRQREGKGQGELARVGRGGSCGTLTEQAGTSGDGTEPDNRRAPDNRTALGDEYGIGVLWSGVSGS